MTLAQTVVDKIEEFCNLSLDNDEQHVELREYQISKVETDLNFLKLLLSSLQSHEPFPNVGEMKLIANGVTGNDKINFHHAYKILVSMK